MISMPWVYSGNRPKAHGTKSVPWLLLRGALNSNNENAIAGSEILETLLGRHKARPHIQSMSKIKTRAISKARKVNLECRSFP